MLTTIFTFTRKFHLKLDYTFFFFKSSYNITLRWFGMECKCVLLQAYAPQQKQKADAFLSVQEHMGNTTFTAHSTNQGFSQLGGKDLSRGPNGMEKMFSSLSGR
ncbi:hypothetical protein NE237_032503 [Protea cynaroides]|uniref:Uncharacterized protein n=1 Tax=Protea cynaroides TaxID=273540 RepID=A0A9Q0L4I1_9MAGN|nr:hypothetical protein NE237_032503 [Protea cynaroides]